MQNGAGDDRAKDRPHQDWHSRVAHEARHMLSASTRYHHLLHRSHQAAAHALENPKCDQGVRGPCQAAQGRGEREGREAPEVERFGSNALHEPAVEREHESECQKIAAGDPLNRREAAVQIHGETGERYVDDGCIELREKRAEHRDGRDLPNQWVEAAGFAGGLRQGRPEPHRWCGPG